MKTIKFIQRIDSRNKFIEVMTHLIEVMSIQDEMIGSVLQKDQRIKVATNQGNFYPLVFLLSISSDK